MEINLNAEDVKKTEELMVLSVLANGRGKLELSPDF